MLLTLWISFKIELLISADDDGGGFHSDVGKQWILNVIYYAY